MINIQWNTVRLGVQMQELINVGQLTAARAVTRFAAQVVRDCHLTTPPGGKGARSNSAARKRGDANIDYDVRHTLISVDDINFTEMLVEKGIKRTVDGFEGKQNSKAAMDIFRNAGFRWVGGVVANPTEKFHRWAMKQNRKYVIPTATEARRDTIIKQLQKRLGYARSGWRAAMSKLKIPVPPWVRRHNGPGYFRGIVDSNKPEILFANMVPYVQGYRNKEGVPIVEAAINRRVDMMKKELAVYYAAIGRGDGRKVAARLQKQSFEALEV